MATKKNSAKSTTKKSTVKTTAKKAAPAKKTVSKKAAPVKKTAAKKATPKKTTPVKKAAVKKAVAPVKKAATKKVATTKKVKASKAAPVKKTAAKKSVAAPKKTAKKVATPVKKAAVKMAPAKKVATKEKVVTPKVVKTTKVSAKTSAKTKTINKSNLKKEPKVVAKPIKAPKTTTAPVKKAKKHDIPVVPVLPARSEFADAIRQKPKSNVNKPGVVIAQRRIYKKDKKEVTQDTMKEYNPSKRSLLDKPEQSSGPVYRYSDEELNEFKELILKRLENAKRELNFLQGLITRKDEAGTEDTDNRFNHMEDGSGAMEREQLSQLAGRQIQFINNLEKALVRIENKTYGICRETGKLIDKARLRAVPHATLSIEAKNARR